MILLFVVIVKDVAALGAELRRICGILGLPAALVTLVKRCACGLWLAALGAELALVYGTA